MWRLNGPDDFIQSTPILVRDALVENQQAFLKKYLVGSWRQYAMEVECEGLMTVRMKETGNIILILKRIENTEALCKSSEI